jgi:hypothetical protein
MVRLGLDGRGFFVWGYEAVQDRLGQPALLKPLPLAFNRS